MHMRWLATLLLLSSSALVPAAELPEARPQPQEQLTFAQLLERLGDRNFQVREQAARAIEAMGTAVLPELRQARQHPDPEVVRRVEGWLPGLERRLVLGPKRVSLHLAGRPVREALESLSQQTGYALQLESNPEREKQLYTFQFDNLPFWEALDRVCDGAGLLLNFSQGEGLSLQHQDRVVPFVQHVGAFRLVAQGFEYGRSVQFGAVPRVPMAEEAQHNEFLRFHFALAVEPKLSLLSAGEVHLTTVLDNENHSLLPPRPREIDHPVRDFQSLGVYPENSLGFQTLLLPPSRSARSIQVLRGIVPLTLLTERRSQLLTERLPEAKGKTFQSGRLSIEVGDLTSKNGEEVELRVTVFEKSQGLVHAPRGVQSLAGRFEIIDDRGEPMDLISSSTSSNGGGAHLHLLFRAKVMQRRPVKLVFQDWLTVQHELAFEFKDLPLP